MNKIKTLIATLPMLICIASCTPRINGGRYECAEAVEADGIPNGRYKVIEITVNGETHQYLKYKYVNSFGLTHWGGCKYCKEQDKEGWR